MKKKILIVVGFIILALIVLTMILTPPVAKWYVNKNGKELTGRRISLDKIRINYATFTLRVIGFKMFEKNDSTVFTGFDTLLVDLQPLRLLKSELELKRLWLINPVSRITKRDTIYNFSDIMDFFSASDSITADTVSSNSVYKFKLADIRLKDGHISYTDEDIDNTTLLDNLSFTIPYLSWNQEESSKAGLKFNFRNGGFFMADGNFDPVSGDFSSKVIVENLDISEFSAYVKPYIYLNGISGLANCNLNISGNPDKPDSLAMNGSFSVTSFLATDNKDRDILGADKISLTLKNASPMAGIFIFDSLALKKPYLFFEMKDSSNNFLELFPPDTADTLALNDADTDTLMTPVFYSINSFSIIDGIVDFVDIGLKDPFKYHLSEIKLNVDSVSSKSTWLTINSTMKLNERGDLKAEIGINPSDPYELKVDYVIKNFQLPDVTPYSKFYLGSAIVYGNMYYAGKTTITARQISSDNKIIIRNAEIGKKSGGIFNLPLRLALYLIKDMNGDIKIDLPVSGDLNDPGIKVGKLIWATFKNFIVKVAASPFIALSNLFGVDPKDIQQLDFNYSDTLLSGSNTRKLDQLLQIKEKKPELNVELAYFNDRTMEKELIAYEEAGKMFREQTGNDYISKKEEFEIFLKTTLAKDTIDLYKDCMTLAGPEKISGIASHRNDIRVKLVEDYLRTKDTAGLIRLFIPGPEAVKNEGSRPVFEVKFSMEE